MKTVSVGLIGTGYMGKAHAIAFHSAPSIFPLAAKVQCEMLAEIDDSLAKHKALELGFNRSTGNWQDLVNDSRIDVVDICSPNFLHKKMALAAIAAGKHVYSEKPLAMNADDALEMTLAAEKAGVKTLVGFNYIKNPASQLAKEIISSGEIGEIVHFRGIHNEDYLADPNVPMSWRLKRGHSGSGALGDLGSHIINMAQHLVGDITAVNGDLQTVIKQRPIAGQDGTFSEVENEDQAHALLRFSQGAIGTIETSRIAWGRKMGLTYEITGTLGTIIFDQERLSEIKLYQSGEKASREGFKTILLGPEHPDYRFFCISAGHGLGYNDQKTVEVRDLIDGITKNKPLWPDFRAGYQVNLVIDAIEKSHQLDQWINIKEV